MEINKLNNLDKLKYLQLSYSTIIDINNILKANGIDELYIDNANIINLDFINNLNSIKRV